MKKVIGLIIIGAIFGAVDGFLHAKRAEAEKNIPAPLKLAKLAGKLYVYDDSFNIADNKVDRSKSILMDPRLRGVRGHMLQNMLRGRYIYTFKVEGLIGMSTDEILSLNTKAAKAMLETNDTLWRGVLDANLDGAIVALANKWQELSK